MPSAVSLAFVPEPVLFTADPPSQFRRGGVLLVSGILHLGLLIILTWAIQNFPPKVLLPKTTAVEVTLIPRVRTTPVSEENPDTSAADEQIESKPVTPRNKDQAIAREAAPSAEKAELVPLSSTGLPRVRQIYSNKILASGDGAEAKSGLMKAYGDERWVQLCNLEALEQLANSGLEMEPVSVLSHIREPMTLKGNQITALGAAVFSKGNWFDLQFECWVKKDTLELADFAFQLGKKIPRAHWESLWLPEPH